MTGVIFYTNFFLASTTVAGALTGLPFAAVSIALERLMGADTSTGPRPIATTAFTALLDSLWISLFALRAGNSLSTASLVLGVLGLVSTAALIAGLWLGPIAGPADVNGQVTVSMAMDKHPDVVAEPVGPAPHGAPDRL